jgi:hypothetical protein
MPTRVLTLLALATLAGSALAADTVYRWTDANGRLHYSDLPAADAQSVERVNVRTGTKVDEPPANAEEAARQKSEKCAAKRAQFTSYSSAVRLVEKDALGREHEYTPQERDDLIAKTQIEIDQLCVGESTPEEG